MSFAVNSHMSQGGPHGRSLSRFCSMKVLRVVLLLPTGWDASPSHGNPPVVRRRYPCYTPGGERLCGVRLLV